MEYYKKTQYGNVIIGICLLSGGFIYSFDGPSEEFLYAFFILMAVVCVLGWLTITIDKTQLKIKMGLGIFGRKVPLNEIKEVKVTRIPWWMGSGVRYRFGRIMYSVQGFKAVEIIQKDDKKIILGTAEPDLLKQKIDSAKSLFS